MSRKTIISQAGNELKQIIENNGGQFEVYIDTSNLDGGLHKGSRGKEYQKRVSWRKFNRFFSTIKGFNGIHYYTPEFDDIDDKHKNFRENFLKNELEFNVVSKPIKKYNYWGNNQFQNNNNQQGIKQSSPILRFVGLQQKGGGATVFDLEIQPEKTKPKKVHLDFSIVLQQKIEDASNYKLYIVNAKTQDQRKANLNIDLSSEHPVFNKTNFNIEMNLNTGNNKGDLDVELACDMLENKNNYKTAILFSGDSDFVYLVNKLKEQDKTIICISQSSSISNELKSATQPHYFDIFSFQDDFLKV